MVDIHSHILYGVDDGSRSIEESLEMAKKSLSIGYKRICCTSHFKYGSYENISYKKNFEVLQGEFIRNNIDIEIISGNELLLDIEGVAALKEGRVNPISDTNYVLVEPIPGMTGKNLIKSLEIVKNLGYRPILAHVERYQHIGLEHLMEIRDLEVIFQVNISSIRGSLRKRCLLLYNNNLIDLLASDSHRTDRRNYDLKGELILWKELVGDDYKKLTETNPTLILQGDKLNLEKSIVVNKKKKNILARIFKR